MTSSIPQLDEEAKQRVEAVLSRAAEDIEFRELLLADPEAALKDSDLTDEEKTALSSMRRVALEEWGVDVRRFRAFLMDNGNKFWTGEDVEPAV
ncbi:Os1348 family NHLP clan protein [Prauserella flavalba]|uniref:Os1348 family NHLP clan protein n=1 Tax=Prauserella flavalba TaxID=1477506 RepID=UPI0036E1C3E7